MKKLLHTFWPLLALLAFAAALYVFSPRSSPPPTSGATPASSSAPTALVSKTENPSPDPTRIPRTPAASEPRTRAQEFGTTFLALLARDPEVALAYVRTLPPGPERAQALIASLDALSRSAPDRALTLARELVRTRDEANLYSLLFDRFARAELPSTVQRLAAMLWASAQPTGALPLAGLTGPFSYWLLHDAPAARAWLDTAPLPPETRAQLQPK
jgi:hypothetical protein